MAIRQLIIRQKLHFSTVYNHPVQGVLNTFPLSSNLMPSPFSRPLFSSSVIPSPSRGHFPLNPPRVIPVATTLWQGTSGAKGLRRKALPTALGDEPRCFDRRPYVVTCPSGIWQRAVHTRFSKSVRLERAIRDSWLCILAGTVLAVVVVLLRDVFAIGVAESPSSLRLL